MIECFSLITKDLRIKSGIYRFQQKRVYPILMNFRDNGLEAARVQYRKK